MKCRCVNTTTRKRAFIVAVRVKEDVIWINFFLQRQWISSVVSLISLEIIVDQLRLVYLLIQFLCMLLLLPSL